LKTPLSRLVLRAPYLFRVSDQRFPFLYYECRYLYCIDVTEQAVLRLSEFTLGRPYHAALCRLASRDVTTSVHSHQDFYELFFVLSGQGEHKTPFGCDSLEPGDLVLVRPGDHHYLVGVTSAGLEWINIAVPVAAWRGMLDLAEVGSGSEWDKSRVPKRVALSGDAKDAAERSFRKALEVFAGRPRRSDLLRFLLEVVELLAVPAESSDSLRPAWLVAACGAMGLEENLKGGVSRLAQLAGVSAGHLCHSMHRYYGMTATTFVADLRLRHAEMLLATTSVSVTEIARRSGFASLSYFSKSFQATQGVPPREFRKRARKAVLP
jgi:AraC-like DNA-binding protein/mannose-6-phosphate isomerase-like protein (cupin superfamily)